MRKLQWVTMTMAALSLSLSTGCGEADDESSLTDGGLLSSGVSTGMDSDSTGDTGASQGTDGSTGSGSTDTGTTDSGSTTDSGTTSDSGTTDSGTTDSGTTDSGTTDSGTTSDSGTTDSGTTDSGGTTSTGGGDNCDDYRTVYPSGPYGTTVNSVLQDVPGMVLPDGTMTNFQDIYEDKSKIAILLVNAFDT